jgi:DNA-binding NtrC family response regulator
MADKLLFIEDDDDQKEIIQERLKDQGFDIDFIDISGKTMLGVAQHFFDNKSHMIIADHDLSNKNVDFSGSEFINYMFKLCPHLQMLILTAHEDAAMSSSDRPILVEQRPQKEKEWAILIAKIKNAIGSYKRQIDESNSLLQKFSEKEKLTPEEQINYMRVSNFLSEIQFNVENDVVNTLKGKTVSGKVFEIADSLKRIEKILEG